MRPHEQRPDEKRAVLFGAAATLACLPSRLSRVRVPSPAPAALEATSWPLVLASCTCLQFLRVVHPASDHRSLWVDTHRAAAAHPPHALNLHLSTEGTTTGLQAHTGRGVNTPCATRHIPVTPPDRWRQPLADHERDTPSCRWAADRCVLL